MSRAATTSFLLDVCIFLVVGLIIDQLADHGIQFAAWRVTMVLVVQWLAAAFLSNLLIRLIRTLSTRT